MLKKIAHARVAIAGAGISGAYLHRLLLLTGCDADLYDTQAGWPCGQSPCAWGTSEGFLELAEAAGLDPEKYVLQRVDHLLMDEVHLEANLMTIHKPAFIKDLLRDKEILHDPLPTEKYDRIIDATGVSRAYLPKIPGDIVLACKQYRVVTDGRLENRIKLGNIGYAWCFPLANQGYHMGCGSFTGDPQNIMKELNWLRTNDPRGNGRILCGCEGAIRLTGPHLSRPFVGDGCPGGIWGVGEAIGCVAPLAGDGIVAGMRSVRILLGHWDDPEGYTRAILQTFDWMKHERKVLDKLINRQHLGFNDARVLKKNSKRMGMKIGLRTAGLLMERLP